MEKIGTYITGYIKGKTPKILYDYMQENTLPYLSPDYLRGKGFPEQYTEHSSNAVLVDDGEVIILWDGSNAGEVFISKFGILASTMTLLEFNEEKIDKKYFGYAFQNLEYILKAKTAGSGIPHADKGIIKRLDFYKPDKTEQIAIANILSKVDEAIASVQKSIAAAECLKKSLMQNLLTGKMKPDGTFRTPEEFYIDKKFGKVPMGWEVKRVDDIFDFYPTASYSRSLLIENGDCKYLHYGDIHTKFDTFLDVSEEPLPCIAKSMIKKFAYLKDGDIIFSDTSEDYEGVGKLVELFNVGDTKAISGLHTLLIRPKTDELINGFKGYLFNDERVRLEFLKYVTGIKVYSISKNCLSKVLLPIPSRTEQEQIKEKLDAVNNVIFVLKNKIKKLERLKKSLMQSLLTGKVKFYYISK